MNLQKKFTDPRKALREAMQIMTIMQEHLRAADCLARAAETVSMYARINHMQIGDYAEVIDGPLAVYKALREPCAAWKEPS